MSDDQKKEVTFHMLKGPSYQTHYMDGAVGGITPHGKIHISFYLERGAVPKSVVHEVDENGVLGHQVSVDRKRGIIREMNCGVILDVKVARDLRDWLDGLLKKISDQETTS